MEQGKENGMRRGPFVMPWVAAPSAIDGNASGTSGFTTER